MQTASVLVATLNGLTLISVLMLIAVGLAVIYGLIGVINLAHGEFVTIGAFSVAAVQISGGNFWLGLLAAPFIGAVAGLCIERGILKRLYERPLSAIMATWGLSLIVQQALQLLFGAAPLPVQAPFGGASMPIGAASYPIYRIFLIAMALSVMAFVWYCIRHTQYGLDLRAVLQDRRVAETLGINTRWVYMSAFTAGAALAALAGALLAPMTVVIAQMGINYLARSFFVVIVGGVGNVTGVIAGSGLIGGLETLFNYTISAALAQALVLALAVVIVRYRPNGILNG